MNFSQLFAALDTHDSNLILFWLIIAFLLGLLTGWFIWGRKVKQLNDALAALNSELTGWKKKYADLEIRFNESEKSLHAANEEISSLTLKVRKYSEENGQLYADLQECRDAKKGNAIAASVAAPVVVAAATNIVANAASDRKDDLKIVEGIGPKIEQLMFNDGIFTWKQLGESPLERLQKILDDAGPRYRIHNPKTWGEQAMMAHNGEWDKLKEFQDFLVAGRDPADLADND
jgi:predicted flap endonuclease-1-like 5' DNA nuclease